MNPGQSGTRQETPRFLICNAVPQNGGDEALLGAALGALARRWPGAQFRILCNHLEWARARLPGRVVALDLDAASWSLDAAYRMLHLNAPRRLRALSRQRGLLHRVDRLLSRSQRRDTLGHYLWADVVISAPGGFLQDHYAIQPRLYGFEVARSMGKPLVVLGQSIGPFWRPESLRRVPEVLGEVDAICLREELSRDCLDATGVPLRHVSVTADMAFLWRLLEPGLYDARPRTNGRVAISLREWPVGDRRSSAATVAKTVELVGKLLETRGASGILFVSTCQGIPGYVDDSELALAVVARLPGSQAQRCEVDRLRRSPQELMRLLSKFDAMIGMRLHACLLAMLAGTPAMGLGYEAKTRGVFAQLGMESNQVDFRSDFPSWWSCAQRFLADLGTIQMRLPDALDAAATRASRNLDVVAGCLGRG